VRREFDAATLFGLLPEIVRIRDAAQVQTGPGPLQSLLTLIAEQIGVLEESLDQAYDDLFIETCADRLVPYIGDLVGASPLPTAAVLPQRAAFANALGYRRRAGTLGMIEQVARDTTGWPARVRETAAGTATTRSVRRSTGTTLADVHVSTGPSARTARVSDAALAIALWRTRAFPLQSIAPVRAPHLGDLAYHLHPAGVDTQLFTADARPLRLNDRVEELRAGLPIITAAGQTVDPADVIVRSLSETNSLSRLTLDDRFVLDPELGRLLVPRRRDVEPLLGSFAYGFGIDLGGGPYDRSAQAAGETVDEIPTSARLTTVQPIAVGAGASYTLRAADGVWPTLAPTAAIAVSGAAGARFTLSGVLVTGTHVAVEGAFACVTFEDCTLRASGHAAAVTIGDGVRRVRFKRCVLGPVHVGRDVEVEIDTCIVDAGDPARVAFGGERGPGGELAIVESTVMGSVNTVLLASASNVLFAGRVMSERFADGCARYSVFVGDDRVPPRFGCIDLALDEATLAFRSRRYGDPRYLQLAPQTAERIRRGADDGGEIGVYHTARFVERDDALRAALPNAVPLGMEATIVHAT
jgi:hypothetical protein